MTFIVEILRKSSFRNLHFVIRTIQGIYINGLKVKTGKYSASDIKTILFWRKEHPNNVLLDNGFLNQACEEDLLIFISLFDYLFKVEGNQICNKSRRFADTKYISAVLQCIISVLKKDPIRKHNLSSNEIHRIKQGSIILLKMYDEKILHLQKMKEIQMSHIRNIQTVHIPIVSQPLTVHWNNTVSEREHEQMQDEHEQMQDEHEHEHEHEHEQMQDEHEQIQYEDTVPPYNPAHNELIRMEIDRQTRASNLSGMYHGLVAKCTILKEKTKRTLSEEYELIACMAERDATYSELLAHI